MPPLRKMKNAVAQGLVPPPPPIPMPVFTPQEPQMDPAAAAPQAPQQAPGRPILPSLSRQDLASVLNYKPDASLQEAVDQSRSRMNEAQTAYDSRANELTSAMANYQTAQQSPFEQYLQNALQQKLVNTLGAENTFGARFNRGFDVGQKLAANIIGPAIGLLSKGGGAVGALQASTAMKADVAQSERSRAAESNALNQSLMNLSALYENLDPKSAKNAAANFKTQIELAKAKMEMQGKAADDLRQATQAFGTAAHNKNSSDVQAAQARAQTLLGLYGHDISNANTQERQFEFDKELPIKQADEVRKNKALENDTASLGIRKSELQLHQDQAAEKNKTDASNANRADTKVQMDALDALRKIGESARTKMSAVGADGVTPRYRNYGEMLKQDKVLQASIQKYKKLAGLDGFSDEEALGMASQPQSNEEQGDGGLDFLSPIGNAIGGVARHAGQMIFGSQEPAKPQAKMTPEQMYEAYKKMRGSNGR